MDVPRRSIQFLERSDGAVLASIICEDLAQIDEVAEVIRSVGPTIVVTPLLDGPQLSSRWAARYASVLADDPGSAVLTLTSYGMAQRSRPNRRDPSSIIALWKDPVRGTREIPLEAGAHGVLLTASVDLTVRRSGDGRQHHCTEFFDVRIFQVRATRSSSSPLGQPARYRPSRGWNLRSSRSSGLGLRRLRKYWPVLPNNWTAPSPTPRTGRSGERDSRSRNGPRRSPTPSTLFDVLPGATLRHTSSGRSIERWPRSEPISPAPREPKGWHAASCDWP